MAAKKALTKRQREILLGIAQGEQQKCIGDRLGITGRTVQFHLVRVRERLGAVSTVHAVWLMACQE